MRRAIGVVTVAGDVIVTASGADTAHRAITAAFEGLATRRSAMQIVTTLGDEVYCSLLREADVMVGNSIE